MADNGKINMPSGMGGLVRFDEEFQSRFMISPAQAMGFVVVVLIFTIALKIFWVSG
jgi:preprotein translocase subunit Sec61beta